MGIDANCPVCLGQKTVMAETWSFSWHVANDMGKLMQSQGQPRAFETWMVLEYCDSGTLRYAIDRGKFDKGFADAAKRTGEPDLAAIRCNSLQSAALALNSHTTHALSTHFQMLSM